MIVWQYLVMKNIAAGHNFECPSNEIAKLVKTIMDSKLSRTKKNQGLKHNLHGCWQA